MAEIAQWKCAMGHVLGVVVRNGRGITQLLLYRHALDMERKQAGEVDVMATVEGLTMDVRCEICGSCRTWVPGAAALKRMLDAFQKAKVHDGENERDRA